MRPNTRFTPSLEPELESVGTLHELRLRLRYVAGCGTSIIIESNRIDLDSGSYYRESEMGFLGFPRALCRIPPSASGGPLTDFLSLLADSFVLENVHV